MRRGFNNQLLPKEAPKKHRHVEAKKRKEKKSEMMKELMCDYREQMGDKFSNADFAASIGVKAGTVRRYFYGYIPHKNVHWPIARYFAPYTGCTADILHHDISETYKDIRLEK